ncbi:hypothetical protein RRV45_20480 [Bacillus sp. DTU_2020_1000418_1_SI_GHA_SEK_038]|uniref:hypothetical protein n=1 Tax=Bacillus sp. DTU_2020_1000418_1_SI_GHA_SEK_038 TaxID=3077585 RepID=UPI0028F01626|nr:hypothetical protein [Bacillus sp. DTU_2020_1000418_1_SI_GHA_SEK_038]WNS75221.1 hypothetical protein RRV45_20480 [Bacillus sp. DTU_2020_1000418_1_SI_GHA_SEK_038]
MKKKAIKLATSTAIAASAFVAAAPANQADAAVNVDQLVQDAQNAGTVLKWAISVEGSADYVTRPYAAYNAAKKAIEGAQNALKGASASDKLKYEARLTDPQIQVKRAQAYIDAITSSEKIKGLTADLDAAVKSGDIEKVEAAYHTATAEYRKQAKLLDRVYGQSTRDGIRNAVKPAIEKLVAELKNDVTVNMLAKGAAADVKADKLEDAAKKLTEAQAILDANVLKWETSLQKSVDDVNTALPLKALSVTRTDKNTVVVKFSKQIDPILPASQFAFNNGLLVHSAKVADDKKSVTLTTSDQAASKTYTLSYQGVDTGLSFTTPANAADSSFYIDQADNAYLDLGQTRTYVVTVKQTDGQPYNGPAVIDLENIAGGAATLAEIATVDGKNNNGAAWGAQWTGDVKDGKVTFVVKSTDANLNAATPLSTYAKPVVTIDANDNQTADATERFVEGGASYLFAEAPNGQIVIDFNVDTLIAVKDKDYFVAWNGTKTEAGINTALKYKYDSNDIFGNGSFDAFENALSAGDIVNVNYNRTVANSSSFTITSDVTETAVSITNPSREVSYEGTTFRFEGKGTAGYKLGLYRDIDGNGLLDATELASHQVGQTVTVTSNGTWVVQANNLVNNAANDYIAIQFPSNSSAVAATTNGTLANTEALSTNVSATATGSTLQTVYRQSFTPATVTFNDVDTSVGLSSGDTLVFTFDNTAGYTHEFKDFTSGTITLEQNFKYVTLNVERDGTNTLVIKNIVGSVPTGFSTALADIKNAGTKISATTGIKNQDKLDLKVHTTAANNLLK